MGEFAKPGFGVETAEEEAARIDGWLADNSPKIASRIARKESLEPKPQDFLLDPDDPEVIDLWQRTEPTGSHGVTYEEDGFEIGQN